MSKSMSHWAITKTAYGLLPTETQRWLSYLTNCCLLRLMTMDGHTLLMGEFYFIGDVGFTHAPLNTMGKAYGGMHAENQIARDTLHDVVYGHSHKRVDKTYPKMGNQYVNIINLGTSLPQGHVEEYARHTLTGWSYGSTTSI